MFFLTPQERKFINVLVIVIAIGIAIQWGLRGRIPLVAYTHLVHLLIINVNTANTDELQKLSGIGPVLAGRIVEYREQHGPFSSIDELRKVKGLTVKRLERIKEDIVL